MPYHNTIRNGLCLMLLSVVFACPTFAQKGVDTSTLDRTVMCGYQGWFAAEGDGSDRGWTHYATNSKRFGPGHCTFDLWPDLSEMDDDEKYPTPFKHADGSTAHVFSPYNPKTVARHFQWMKDYGIHGVFLQRFGASTKHPKTLNHRNVVTRNVMAGAAAHGRSWAMMYDLSGLREGEIESVVIPDWKRLVDEIKIRMHSQYQHHEGKPVISVWGIGFNDNRAYTLAECQRLVTFLQDDPTYGGNTVMMGVPTYWRTQTRDALEDPLLETIIGQADIVSPWMVGRFRDDAGIAKMAKEVVTDDIKRCQSRQQDYLPVLFPGFSWHNLMKVRDKDSDLDLIPRRGGAFFWNQAAAYTQAGATMLYVAMFDEIDEGTAIFKCTNDVPVGASPFLGFEGLPSDHYLWLTGEMSRMLRNKTPLADTLPVRKTP